MLVKPDKILFKEEGIMHPVSDFIMLWADKRDIFIAYFNLQLIV